MAGELYPSTKPKLMGPRTDAKVARYKFLFFTLLQREREEVNRLSKKKTTFINPTVGEIWKW